MNKITEGLLKAWGNLARQSAAKPPKHPKFEIKRDSITAVHAAGCLSDQERTILDVGLAAVEAAETEAEAKEAFARIPTSLYKLVPLYRAHLLPRGKTYPKGGSLREAARASKRFLKAQGQEVALAA